MLPLVPEPQKLAFTILPSEPLAILVTGMDGKKYKTLVTLVVIDVVDTGRRQVPQDLPLFEIKAQMLAETQEQHEASAP